MPPTFEAQIWQWPISTLNPADTNMYMFTAGQDIPGRGKRRLRAAVAEKEVDLAENEIAVRAREVIDRVKRKLEELKPSFPPGMEVKVVYDRSDLIGRAIETLRTTLFEEMIVVSLVILLFLVANAVFGALALWRLGGRGGGE